MPCRLVNLCLFEAFPLHRDTVQKFGTFYILQIPQYFDEVIHVVPVHGAEVSETKSLEQVTLT